MRRALVPALLVLVALAGCGDDADDAGPAGPAGLDRNQTDALVDAAAEAPSCDALGGMPTDVVVSGGACTSPTGLELLESVYYDCPDGRKLQWNNRGWGYAGDVWHAHERADGKPLPPQADLDAC